jgi:hypothetical protein
MADIIHGFDQEDTISTAEVRERRSRMERLLIPTNWMDQLYRSSKATETYIKRSRATFKQKRLGYHGIVKKDAQYSGKITFSTDDGYTFSNPAVNVEGNRVIQMKLELTQHQVEPLIMGWELHWHLPNGWTWTDNLGRVTIEITNTNPLIVTRTTRSPANPLPVGFRVIVAKRYYG